MDICGVIPYVLNRLAHILYEIAAAIAATPSHSTTRHKPLARDLDELRIDLDQHGVPTQACWPPHPLCRNRRTGRARSRQSGSPL